MPGVAGRPPAVRGGPVPGPDRGVGPLPRRGHPELLPAGIGVVGLPGPGPDRRGRGEPGCRRRGGVPDRHDAYAHGALPDHDRVA